MFGKKTIECPAGEWTTIIQSRFAQMPATWNVTLRSEGVEVAGEFEEKKSAWVFPNPPTQGQLRNSMVFERGYWNTFYSVRIRPMVAVTAELE